MSNKKTSFNDSGLNRIREIELMKVIAIIGMIFVHVFEESPCYSDDASGATLYIGVVISFFGGALSAGVFMFAMGWGASFTDKATPKTYLDRFLQLALLGLLVNVLQQWIPMLIAPDDFGRLSERWHALFAADIYPFAALAMLYLACMKKLSKNTAAMVILSGILLTVSLLINGLIPVESYTTGNDVSDTLLGLFIRENEYSYFPFVSWIAFPVAGFGIGALYRILNDPKRFAGLMFCIGMPIIVICSLLMSKFGIPNAALLPYYVTDTEYYAMHSLGVLCSCGIIMTEYAIAWFILKLTKRALPEFMLKMSKNVMHIYVWQWLINGLLAGIIIRLDNIYLVILLASAVLIASYWLSVFTTHLIQKNPDNVQKHLLR